MVWYAVAKTVVRKKSSIVSLQKKLLKWFLEFGRDLPWRKTVDSYRIWVSEIMLQQTQVERVKDFYIRFLKRFPTVQSLAKASWQEVLECWRGLGYYRRARNLHEAAKIVVREHGSQLPAQFAALQKLPGIGFYTAAAILTFAFKKDVAALDTNIRRVLERIFAKKWQQMDERHQFVFASSLLQKGKGSAMNHALMDLGATICTSLNPQCDICPLKDFCVYAQKKSIRNRPVFSSKSSLVSSNPSPRRPQNASRVAVGVIIRDGKVLISKRSPHVSFGSYWEFPGGKLEEGEDERSCLKREIFEELGIEVAVRPAFYKVATKHQGKNIFLSFHRCSVLLGEPKAKEVEDFVWVPPEKLFQYQFPPVNTKVIELLLQKKAMFRS